MNERAIELLMAEGVQTAVKEQWVDPLEIQDYKLRLIYQTACYAYDAFVNASLLAELETERIQNES